MIVVKCSKNIKILILENNSLELVKQIANKMEFTSMKDNIYDIDCTSSIITFYNEFIDTLKPRHGELIAKKNMYEIIKLLFLGNTKCYLLLDDSKNSSIINAQPNGQVVNDLIEINKKITLITENTAKDNDFVVK